MKQPFEFCGQIPPDLAHLFAAVPLTELVTHEAECRQRLLFGDTVYHGHLSAAIYELDQLGKMSETWKAVFEQAYEKIPLNKRIYARDSMRYLYGAFRDYKMAAKFLPSQPYTNPEIADVLQIWLRLKRFGKAKALLKLCQTRLAAAESREEKLLLRKTIKSQSITLKNLRDAPKVRKKQAVK